MFERLARQNHMIVVEEILVLQVTIVMLIRSMWFGMFNLQYKLKGRVTL